MMLEKRDVDAENAATIAKCGAHAVGLLQAADAEALFGCVTIAYHFRAGALVRRVVTKESSEMLLLPSQQN